MVYYPALGTSANEADNGELRSGMSIFGLGPIEIGVILAVVLIVFAMLRGALRGT